MSANYFEFVPKSETENKTIRFPLPLIHRINSVVREKSYFSSFVVQACEYALDNMKEDDTPDPDDASASTKPSESD